MYIIQEIQTNNGQTVVAPAFVKETYQQAESTFYTICGSAVLSDIPKHTVIVYDEEGTVVPELKKCFFH